MRVLSLHCPCGPLPIFMCTCIWSVLQDMYTHTHTHTHIHTHTYTHTHTHTHTHSHTRGCGWVSSFIKPIHSGGLSLFQCLKKVSPPPVLVPRGGVSPSPLSIPVFCLGILYRWWFQCLQCACNRPIANSHRLSQSMKESSLRLGNFM